MRTAILTGELTLLEQEWEAEREKYLVTDRWASLSPPFRERADESVQRMPDDQQS